MKNKKVIIEISVITIFTILLRLIIPFSFYFFNSKYRFTTTLIPYYYDADSYFYAKILEEHFNKIFVYIIPLLFTIVSLIIFYFICRKTIRKDLALIITLNLSCFLYFFNQTILGQIDTPSLIFFSIMLCVLFWINTKHNLIYIIPLLIVLTSISLFWSGRPIVILLILSGVLLQIARRKWQYIILVLVSIITLIIYSDKFYRLIKLKFLNVQEYLTPDYYLYYILFFFICYIIFKNIKFYTTNDIIKFFVGCFMFAFSLSLVLVRFSFFAVPFMFIILGAFVEDKRFYYLLLFISITVLVIGFYNDRPFLDNNSYEIIQNIKQDYPIVSLWEYGHAISYITNKETIYKAQPEGKYQNIICNSFLSKDLIYLDNLNLTRPYYIYINKLDILKCISYFNIRNERITNKQASFYNANLIVSKDSNFLFVRSN